MKAQYANVIEITYRAENGTRKVWQSVAVPDLQTENMDWWDWTHGGQERIEKAYAKKVAKAQIAQYLEKANYFGERSAELVNVRETMGARYPGRTILIGSEE